MATMCPSCKNEVPPGMPTCGWCGAALNGGEERTTVGVHETDRRVFGVPPATGLLVLGAGLAVLAVFLLVTGSLVVGVLLLLAALALLAAFPGVARRPDESDLARRAARSYDGLRERADATIETLAARAQARRQVNRIGAELEQLERSRGEAIAQLGEAAYARDEAELERLRGEVATADAALEAKRAERDAVLAETEERVDGAKLRAQPTERLEREEAGDDADRPAG